MSFWGKNFASNAYFLKNWYTIESTPKNKFTSDNKMAGNKRIGPHPSHIISIIYGTLLGDSYLEKRINNIRISFEQENNNMEYLMWLWNTLSKSGYCTTVKPKILIKLGSGGKIRRYYKLNTFTYSSLNFLYDEWYRDGIKKRVPLNIEKYLTPLALACWIMDDGTRVGNTLKFCTNEFLKEDILILSNSLKSRYDLNTTIQSAGVENQWVLYVKTESMSKLVEVVKPYIVKSMSYKLGL